MVQARPDFLFQLKSSEKTANENYHDRNRKIRTAKLETWDSSFV